MSWPSILFAAPRDPAPLACQRKIRRFHPAAVRKMDKYLESMRCYSRECSLTAVPQLQYQGATGAKRGFPSGVPDERLSLVGVATGVPGERFVLVGVEVNAAFDGFRKGAETVEALWCAG